MNSLILRIAARYLMPLLLVVSLMILFRGHNEPGGGFIGGLFASSGFILYTIAFGVDTARRKLRVNSLALIGLGLLVALASGITALFQEQPFLTGQWRALSVTFLPEIYIGTPLIFDVGVFLLVIGVVLTIVFSLLEKELW